MASGYLPGEEKRIDCSLPNVKLCTHHVVRGHGQRRQFDCFACKFKTSCGRKIENDLRLRRPSLRCSKLSIRCLYFEVYSSDVCYLVRDCWMLFPSFSKPVKPKIGCPCPLAKNPVYAGRHLQKYESGHCLVQLTFGTIYTWTILPGLRTMPLHAMGQRGTPWPTMGHHGAPSDTTAHRGTPWDTLRCHGTPWHTMGHHGTPRCAMGPMRHHHAPWHTVGRCGTR